MHLSNPHRQLQVTAFNAEVDKFYDYAETGKVCPSSTSFCCNVGQAELWPAAEACVLACTKNKKSLNFASSGSWHLKVSTLPTGEVGQKYYALKKSSPFVNSL